MVLLPAVPPRILFKGPKWECHICGKENQVAAAGVSICYGRGHEVRIVRVEKDGRGGVRGEGEMRGEVVNRGHVRCRLCSGVGE